VDTYLRVCLCRVSSESKQENPEGHQS
jgi:hypothetical protein